MWPDAGAVLVTDDLPLPNVVKLPEQMPRLILRVGSVWRNLIR